MTGWHVTILAHGKTSCNDLLNLSAYLETTDSHDIIEYSERVVYMYEQVTKIGAPLVQTEQREL